MSNADQLRRQLPGLIEDLVVSMSLLLKEIDATLTIDTLRTTYAVENAKNVMEASLTWLHNGKES